MKMRGEVLLFLFLRFTYLTNCERVPRQLFSFESPSSETCTTPDGTRGSCLKIKQCPTLLELLMRSKRIPGAADFLRRSLCRYDNSDPVVCCPQQSDQYDVSTRKPSIPNDIKKDARDEYSRLPSPPYCGVIINGLTRIVNGMPAELGDFPWMTALGYRSKRNPTIRWLCGGALITSRHVLTAAHCTRHPSLTLTKARVGDLDLDETVSDGANPVEVNILSALPHPQYLQNNKFDDIAILTLEKEVPFSKHIRPICLPKLPELFQMEFTGKRTIIAGWGDTSFRGNSSSVLQKAQILVVTNEDCNRAYKTKGANIISRQVCAGTGGTDACQGDSGGPLMYSYNFSMYLIGIVSYGYRCAEPGFPGVYSKVTSYLNWIAQNIN